MALDNASLMLGAFDDASKAAKDYGEEQAPLTPVQRYAMEVVHGRMSAQEASTRAKMEHAQLGIPHGFEQVAQDQQPSIPAPGSPSMPSMSAPSGPGMSAPRTSPMDMNQTLQSAPPPRELPNSPMPQGLGAPAPQDEPAPGPQFVMPKNQKEYRQLMDAYSSLGLNRPQARPSTALTFQERQELARQNNDAALQRTGSRNDTVREIAGIKQQGSNTRLDKNIYSKEKIAGMQTDAKLKYGDRKNATAREIADERVSATRDIAAGKDAQGTANSAMRVRVQRIGQLEASKAKLLASTMNGPPSAAIKQAIQRIDQDLARLRKDQMYDAQKMMDTLAPEEPVDTSIPGGEPVDPSEPTDG